MKTMSKGYFESISVSIPTFMRIMLMIKIVLNM